MKIIKEIFLVQFLIFNLAIFNLRSEADTHTATSASYTDVSVAVSSASDGDTVQIPAGTATWSSTLVVTKAVRIIGAGKAFTIINNSAGTAFIFSRTQDTLTRLSGIRFNNSDGQSPIIALVGPMSKARVDNCIFNKGDCAIGTNFLGDPYKGSGPVYGVADHCEFYNMVRPYFPTDIRQGDSAFGAAAWTEPILPGSDKMMYFEDNQFIWDSNLTATNGQGALYGQYGGKCCFRYNTCTGFCTYVDAHGDGPAYGTIYYEIYNNTFNMDLTHCMQGDIMWQRGGQWICHDNVITGANGGVLYRLSVYHESDLEEHRVKNSYFWNDTYRGNTDESTMVTVTDSGQTSAGYSAAHIHLNQEYFLHAPQSGQTYYPYTPYTYPHPLTIDTDPTPPGAPAAVRDGTAATADSSFTYSTVQLSANWDASADVESGISKYYFAIGSSPGATNITNWTALGNVLTVTKTGLSLIIGTTYYFSVKAVNGAGLTGIATNSNGQVVLENSSMELPGMKAYPNPCSISKDRKVTFLVGAGVKAEVKIYTVTRRLVKEIRDEAGAGEVIWDATNQDGEKILTGVYLYKVTIPNGDRTTGKLAIVK